MEVVRKGDNVQTYHTIPYRDLLLVIHVMELCIDQGHKYLI